MHTPMLKAACLLASAHLIQAQLAITNVSIVDVNSGNIVPQQNIIIEGNQIARIERAGGNQSANGNRIDGTGKFAIPGLCDMHVHVYFSNDTQRFPVGDNITLPLMVANGITCIRDVSSDLGAIKAARTRVAAHQLEGPRVFMTGPMLNGINSTYQAALRLSARAEARKAVQDLKSQGVDFIKVHLLPTSEVFDEIAKASKEEKIMFGGHVPNSVTAQEAMNMGMGYIEHMSRIESQDDINAVKDKKVWQCPTLKLAPDTQRFALTNALFQASNKMVAGTDSPAGRDLCPGVSLLDELELMNQKAGLTPLQTLQTATKNAADLLGKICNMGTIETGKLADLVLLDRNPLQDIKNVRSTFAVVADGQLYSRNKIDQILARANQLVQCNPQEGRLAARDFQCWTFVFSLGRHGITEAAEILLVTAPTQSRAAANSWLQIIQRHSPY